MKRRVDQQKNNKPRGYYAGCWECLLCNSVNWPNRNYCFNKNCKGKKLVNGKILDQKQAESINNRIQKQKSSSHKPTNYWICINCAKANPDSQKECSKCQTNKYARKTDKITFSRGSTAIITAGGIIDDKKYTINISREKISSYLYLYWYTNSRNFATISFKNTQQSTAFKNIINQHTWSNPTAVKDQLFRVKVFEHPLRPKKMRAIFNTFEPQKIIIDIPIHYTQQDFENELNNIKLNKNIKNSIKFIRVDFQYKNEWNFIQNWINDIVKKPENICPAGACMRTQRSRYKACTVEFNTLKEAHKAMQQMNKKKIQGCEINAQLDLVSKILIKDPDVFKLMKPEMDKKKIFLQQSKFGYDIRMAIPWKCQTITTDDGKIVSKAEIILYGNTYEALTVCRATFEDLLSPLVVKFNDFSEFRVYMNLFIKYLKKLQQKQPEFRKLLYKTDNEGTFYKLQIYGVKGLRMALKKEIFKIKSYVNTIQVPTNKLFMQKFNNVMKPEFDKTVMHTLRRYNVFIERYKQDSIDIIHTNIPVINTNDEKCDDTKIEAILDAKKVLQTAQHWVECSVKSKKDTDIWYNEKTLMVSFEDPTKQDVSVKMAKKWEKIIKEKVTRFNNIKKNEKKTNDDEKKDTSSNTCAICFMDIESYESFYQLRICNHSFHDDCFQMQIKSCITATGTRPVKCAKCSENISLIDISANLNNEEYQIFLRQCVRDYIGNNTKKYINCPTPDCSAIIDKNWDIYGSGLNNEYDKHVFNCSECSKYYCLRCKDENGIPTPYHFGEPCDTEIKVKFADELFQKFMEEFIEKNDVKKCPDCGKVGDKMEGTCNRAICAHCGSMFCWICLFWVKDDSKNAGKVYSHLSAVHGGFW